MSVRYAIINRNIPDIKTGKPCFKANISFVNL